MRKILSGLVAFAMLVSTCPILANAADTAYVKANKTNFTVGTTGTLTPVGTTGTVTYTSSDTAIASVSAAGVITAVAPGTATITPSVGDPITITVYAKAPDNVTSNIAEDVAAGKLTLDYERGVAMSQKRNGTKLWAYSAGSVYYTDAGTNTALLSPTNDDCYMSFVYKLDGVLDSMTAHTFGYGDIANYSQVRTDIGYLTDDTVTFGDRTNPTGTTFTWGSSDLNWWGTEGGTVGTAAAPIALNTNVWTKVTNVSWSSSGNNADVTTSQIPSNAKYVVVLLRQGTLADGTAKLGDQYFRYIGAQLNYKKSLVAGEIVDNKAVLTFNSDIGSASGLTVTQNGNTVTPTISYDASTYTATIDGSFANADDITVTSGYGTWSGKVPGTAADTSYDRLYFKPSKTTYTVGTAGKIDLVVEKDGAKRTDTLATTYTSDNTSVATVDSSGNITAVAAGTAVVTPAVTSLPSVTFDPITITVISTGGTVTSNVAADAAAGKLTLDYDRGAAVAQKRNGTKLWSLSSNTQFYTYENTTYTANTYDAGYMSFVYKLDGPLDSMTTHIFGYGDVANYSKVRTDIGYLTDDTITFKGKDEITYTWGSSGLNWWGTEGGTVGTAEVPITLNTNVWTKVADSNITWSVLSGNDVDAATSQIPANAKYVVILLREGTLADGTAKLTDQYFRYAGVTFNYKTTATGELNKDKKVAMTFNKDVSNASFTVTKNGTAVTPTITYDSATYTYYIDAALAEGDTVNVTSDYGNYSGTVTDTRTQISAVTLKNESNEAITALSVGQTAATATVTVSNADAGSYTGYVAVYDSSKKLVKVVSAPFGVSAATAQATLSLTGLSVQSGYTLKALCWDSDMMPTANYKGITTSFATDEF